MSTETILEEVLEARIDQINQGWTPEHDLAHGEVHLHLQAQERLMQLDWIAGDIAYILPSRERLIHAIALLVAAVEVKDAEDECRVS